MWYKLFNIINIVNSQVKSNHTHIQRDYNKKMTSHTQHQVLSNFLIYVIFIFHLYISVILSSPVPQLQFQFPKNGVTFSESKNEKLSFSTSNANDEYKEVQACLDDDYSMPYFNRTTGEVNIQAL